MSPRQIGQYWKPTANPPPKRSPWKKETNKHKPQISLIEAENKFELMETEPSKSSKTETLNTSKASKSGGKA